MAEDVSIADPVAAATKSHAIPFGPATPEQREDPFDVRAPAGA
jgi:hypothetical protein